MTGSKPFPWESQPDAGEAYIAVDPLILEAIRIDPTDNSMQRVLRVIMSVASINPIDGCLVIGVKLTRDLEGVSGDTSPDLTSNQVALAIPDPSAQHRPAVQHGSSRPDPGRRRA